jgi:hypothetical protein
MAKRAAKKDWGCKHKEREKLGGGRVHCFTCGKTFTSPAAKVFHGTVRGYHKHKRDRSATWCWPSPAGTCGCREAYREHNQQVRKKPESVAARHIRDSSRQAAMLNLRRQFPAEYQRFYMAEVTARTGQPCSGDAVPLPVWDDLVAQLVKAAVGSDEHEVLIRVREGWASPSEKNVMRITSRLRALLALAHSDQKRTSLEQ